MIGKSEKRRSIIVRAATLLLLLILTGCSAIRPAEPLAANERYVCRAGSALKYRESKNTAWPEYWIPTRPGSNCKRY